MGLTVLGGITIVRLCCSEQSDSEHLSPFKRRMRHPSPPTNRGRAGLPGQAQGPPGSPPGSPTLSRTGNGSGSGRREGSWLGHIHVCAGGGGSRKKDRKLPPTPPPTSLSSNFCWTPSHRQPGGPQFLSHLDRRGGRRRNGGKRLGLCSISGRRWEVPTHPLQGLVDRGACTLPQVIPLPSGGKGQRKPILAKVTVGRGLSALGSPSIQGVNRLGSETLRIPTSFPSPRPERHPLEFPACLLSGTHTSSGHTHSGGPPVLHAHTFCVVKHSDITHTHTQSLVSLTHTESLPYL